jgi:ATP-binding cassette subfamily B protein
LHNIHSAILKMQYTAFQLTKKILKHARPFWGQLIGLFIVNLLATPLALLAPIPLKILIDTGFGNHAMPGFILLFFENGHVFSFQQIAILSATLVVIIALITNIHVLIQWLASTYTGEKLVLNFRTILFNHIQRLSLTYHDTKGTADSLYRIQYDTQSTRTFLIDNFSSLLSSFLTLFAMTYVMFYINWHFAFIALCVMPPLGILMRMSTTRLRKGWKQVKDNQSRAMSVVHEALNSLRVVKAFGQEQGEEDRFVAKADEAVKWEVKMARTGATFDLLVGLVFAVGSAFFIYYGAMYVRSGEMTLGELTLIIAYLTQVFGPLEKISKNINSIQSSITSIERIFSILDKEKEVRESAHPVHVGHLSGTFEFEKVAFNYDTQRTILHDVTFKINPGDRVGIMGSTGAGKSTLINLITRFYDPTSGRIIADGKDIREYKLDDYRKQFAIVMQEPVLFSSSIEENIAYGKPKCTQKEIIEAAKSANAHDFIMRSKEGYATLVGQRGMQLSGGERQRISIARAFIKNAPVLIMDEPTSSLDIRTESQIMDAMEQLMIGRTTFLITHRIDTLKTCNIILHLEKGKIIDIVNNTDPEFFESKKLALINAYNH